VQTGVIYPKQNVGAHDQVSSQFEFATRRKAQLIAGHRPTSDVGKGGSSKVRVRRLGKRLYPEKGLSR
jgi:hypothetical protein